MANYSGHSFFIFDIACSAIHSLLLHKLRSSLSILGIVCGVMAVFSILAIGEGAQQETMRQVEQMGVKNVYIRADNLNQEQLNRARKYHSRGLQVSDLKRIQALDSDIKRVAAVRNRMVDLVGFPDHITPRVMETTDNYLTILGLSMSSGRFINERDIAGKNRVCVLGWALFAALGIDGKPQEMLHIGSDVWKIVGVIKKRDAFQSGDTRISLQDINDVVIIPMGTMAQTKEERSNTLSELVVEFGSADNVIAHAAVVERRLQVAHHGVDDFNIVIPMELLAQSKRVQRLFTIVFGAIGGLSLVIGGIGIMNIMLASVSERVREIGLRRAVGARPYHIIMQFIIEAVVLTVSGGIIGTFGGFVLAKYISYVAGWPVYFTETIVFVPLLLAIITGGFFGLYPALKASKMDPLRALGYLT